MTKQIDFYGRIRDIMPRCVVIVSSNGIIHFGLSATLGLQLKKHFCVDDMIKVGVHPHNVGEAKSIVRASLPANR